MRQTDFVTDRKTQRIPLLNSIFGENAKGENGLKVFADTWRENNKWDANDYAIRTVMAAFSGGVIGMIPLVLASGLLVEEPSDPTINRENTSIVRTDGGAYAAIQTSSGAQIYTLSDDINTMAFVVNPREAEEIVSQVIADFERASSEDFCCGYPSPVLAEGVSVPLNSGPRGIVRDLDAKGPLHVYDLSAYAQGKIGFWSDVSADIAAGDYAVIQRENIPLTLKETQLRLLPYGIIPGAIIGPLLLYGLGGVLPNARIAAAQLSRPGFGRRKTGADAPSPKTLNV